MKKEYTIDGKNFSNLEEFFVEVNRVLIPGANWGHNLDAFNDILRGGFGTPDDGFVIRWKNSKISSEKLGHKETVTWLLRKLEICHPSNRDSVKAELARAQQGEGQTLFEILVEIIKDRSEDGVVLRLE